MNEFVKKMLVSGAELDQSTTHMESNMIINDAEILYRKEVERFAVPAATRQSEHLDTAWKALVWVGFERGNEFDDDDIKEMLGNS